jgi:hypothetical protein
MQDGYATGLKPSTNFPNPRSHEQTEGRVALLQPGQTREVELRVEFHLDALSIRLAEQNTPGYKPPVHPTSTVQPGWCTPFFTGGEQHRPPLYP